MVADNIALEATAVNGAEEFCRKSTTQQMKRGVVSTFEYIADTGLKYHVGRKQLPLLPAYAYTDYKAQGKSLQRVIVGLNGAESLQSLYVVISRGTSLNARSTFRSTTLYGRFGQDVCDEFATLEVLDARTRTEYEQLVVRP
ncbi:hypothetical protein B0H13DRAFT_1866144 [Mycena leptocephala]|nr:hypothetical protein B0H13DRAFT_1866144 [Mycena leptocephala]